MLRNHLGHGTCRFPYYCRFQKGWRWVTSRHMRQTSELKVLNELSRDLVKILCALESPQRVDVCPALKYTIWLNPSSVRKQGILRYRP